MASILSVMVSLLVLWKALPRIVSARALEGVQSSAFCMFTMSTKVDDEVLTSLRAMTCRFSLSFGVFANVLLGSFTIEFTGEFRRHMFWGRTWETFNGMEEIQTGSMKGYDSSIFRAYAPGIL